MPTFWIEHNSLSEHEGKTYIQVLIMLTVVSHLWLKLQHTWWQLFSLSRLPWIYLEFVKHEQAGPRACQVVGSKHTGWDWWAGNSRVNWKLRSRVSPANQVIDRVPCLGGRRAGTDGAETCWPRGNLGVIWASNPANSFPLWRALGSELIPMWKKCACLHKKEHVHKI